MPIDWRTGDEVAPTWPQVIYSKRAPHIQFWYTGEKYVLDIYALRISDQDPGKVMAYTYWLRIGKDGWEDIPAGLFKALRTEVQRYRRCNPQPEEHDGHTWQRGGGRGR